MPPGLRLQHEHAVGLGVAGEVVEIRARSEAIGRVVRSNLLVAGGDDERLAEEELRGQRAPPRRECLLKAHLRRELLRMGLPVARHEREQRGRRLRVVAGFPRGGLCIGYIGQRVGFFGARRHGVSSNNVARIFKPTSYRGGGGIETTSSKASSSSSLLLELVRLGVAGGGARALRAGDAGEREGQAAAVGELVGAEEEPRAHVPRLLLHPGDLPEAGVTLQLVEDLLAGVGIELFHPHDGGVAVVARLPGVEEIGDLAGAEQHAAHALRIDGRVADDALEVGGEVVERAGGLFLAEERLGRHDDERLAQRAEHLPTQRVEVLRGRGEVADLPVVLGGHREVALEPRAGSAPSRPSNPCGSSSTRPLSRRHLSSADTGELIDDHLRAVGEVAELRFPEDQRLRGVEAVAVVEAHDAILGERAVAHLERPLTGSEVLKRRVGVAVA